MSPSPPSALAAPSQTLWKCAVSYPSPHLFLRLATGQGITTVVRNIAHRRLPICPRRNLKSARTSSPLTMPRQDPLLGEVHKSASTLRPLRVPVRSSLKWHAVWRGKFSKSKSTKFMHVVIEIPSRLPTSHQPSNNQPPGSHLGLLASTRPRRQRGKCICPM